MIIDIGISSLYVFYYRTNPKQFHRFRKNEFYHFGIIHTLYSIHISTILCLLSIYTVLYDTWPIYLRMYRDWCVLHKNYSVLKSESIIILTCFCLFQHLYFYLFFFNNYRLSLIVKC